MPLFTGFRFGFATGAGGPATPGVTASGGSTVAVGDYTFHVFNVPNSDNFTATGGPLAVEYVVAGGGGGGGSGATGNGSNHYGSAGGGAGGLRTGSFTATADLAYIVEVGQGGSGSPANMNNPGIAAKGNGSKIKTPTGPNYIVATGGGGGENRAARSLKPLSNPEFNTQAHGGSGGGSCMGSGWDVGETEASPDGISPTVQGNNGGYANSDVGFSGGGGGGAGSVGENAPGDGIAGDGGNGSPLGPTWPGAGIAPAVPSPIRPNWSPELGSTGLLCGGGGGAAAPAPTTSGGSSGPGGGGKGGYGAPTGEQGGYPGKDGTGGGAGGGGQASGTGAAGGGGAGGDGIVMIRYLTSLVDP